MLILLKPNPQKQDADPAETKPVEQDADPAETHLPAKNKSCASRLSSIGMLLYMLYLYAYPLA
jgi:hypothetical protein